MIEVKDMQVKYDDFIAIDNINIEVEKGEFFTLLGPSGCGKTTTLRAIAGFNPPSKGRVFLDGEDITEIPVEQKELGMVFQSYALFPTMTVYDNIAYGLKVAKMPKKEMDTRVYELAKVVELSIEQLDKNVSDLSGGQQQRVAIARALAKKPSVMLFDEPLSNLDAKLRKQLRAELKNIQRETGMTAVYVTHDQEEALELSDKIAVFNNGYIEQIGTPQEIYNKSATEFVCNFIGDANYLSLDIIKLVNEQVGHSILDEKKRHYIREEKIRFGEIPWNDRVISLPAKLHKTVYQGTFTTLYCDVAGSVLKVINKNDDTFVSEENTEMTLCINLDDILSYEVK